MAKFVRSALVVLIIFLMVGLTSDPTKIAGVKIQAAPSASERNRAVMDLKDMAYIQWKTSSALYIWNHTYTSNIVYKGMPYTQTYNTTYSDFLSRGNLNIQTNVLTYNGNARVGNDCSTVPALAWKFKFPSIDYTGIYTANYLSCAKNGSNSTYHLVNVGSYTMGTYNSTLQYVDDHSDEMPTYYKLLKKGDCCLKYYGSTKHVIVVEAVGTNCVYITDQIGWSDGDSFSTWRHYKKMTWDDLASQGYVPMGFA